MTNKRFFIPQLDSLRFIAFLFIFIHHSSFQGIPFLASIQNIGWIGVDIFFCLSAFLLTRLLLFEIADMRSVNIPNFFMRRILRIWPLYFTYCIIAILFSYYQGVLTHENWFRALGLLSFTDNILASIHYYNPILFTGHLWTISMEEQFYLMIPFVVSFLAGRNPRLRNLLLFIVLIIGTFIRLVFIDEGIKHPAIWVLPVTHFESILAGIFLGFQGRI